jgi:hypothetical protein
MWARLVNAALGIWLMAAPAVLEYGEPASTSDRIVGPVAAAAAVIAMWQVTRELRWINLALGLWLIAAPWLLGYGTTATINSSVVGLLMALAALVRGGMSQRYGGGWSELWPPCSGERARQEQEQEER